MTKKPSSISKKHSTRLPSFVTRILKSPLSSRLMPPASGPCCLSTTVAFSPPSLRIFIPETDPCGAELRHWKSRTASHQVSFGEVASLAGGSFISIHRHNRPQECTVPQRSKTPQHPSSPLGHILHTFPFFHHLPSRTPETQGRCTLPVTPSKSAVRTWTHSPSSPHCQPHPIGTHQTHLWCNPHWASSAGRPRREYVRALLPERNPNGLSSPSIRLWTPRQPTNPLAPSSSVLVAQYVRGCNQVCPQLFSLCHV